MVAQAGHAPVVRNHPATVAVNKATHEGPVTSRHGSDCHAGEVNGSQVLASWSVLWKHAWPMVPIHDNTDQLARLGHCAIHARVARQQTGSMVVSAHSATIWVSTASVPSRSLAGDTACALAGEMTADRPGTSPADTRTVHPGRCSPGPSEMRHSRSDASQVSCVAGVRPDPQPWIVLRGIPSLRDTGQCVWRSASRLVSLDLHPVNASWEHLCPIAIRTAAKPRICRAERAWCRLVDTPSFGGGARENLGVPVRPPAGDWLGPTQQPSRPGAARS